MKSSDSPFYKSGDLVRLKSGGPVMTLEAATPAGALVSWFDGNTLHHAKLFYTLIEPANETAKSSFGGNKEFRGKDE